MIDIEITNETIKINTKIYVIKHIRNIEYKEEKINFLLMKTFLPLICFNNILFKLIK